MAKAPTKRRGITLGARADNPAALDLLNVEQPVTSSIDPAPDQARAPADGAGADPSVVLDGLREQLADLRRMNAELDSHWQARADRQQEQLRQIERECDEIAAQAARLQALAQSRRRPGRLGVLLSLLAVVGVAALGFHTWPRVQEVAGELNRVSTGVAELAPKLHSVRGELSALSSEMGQMGTAVASLREDVSGARTELGSLRQVAAGSSEKKPRVQAAASPRPAVARASYPGPAAAANPYRVVRPMMRW
jgi:hypothetical protein